jgi:hypothetical protein
MKLWRGQEVIGCCYGNQKLIDLLVGQQCRIGSATTMRRVVGERCLTSIKEPSDLMIYAFQMNILRAFLCFERL